MRTTLNLSDALVAEAKACAASEGITLTSLIEEALRDRLQRRDDSPPEPLPTYGKPGTNAFRVNIDDKDAVWDALDDVA